MAKFAQLPKTGRTIISDKKIDPFGVENVSSEYTFARMEEIEKVLKDAINGGIISSSQEQAQEFVEVDFEQTVGE